MTKKSAAAKPVTKKIAKSAAAKAGVSKAAVGKSAPAKVAAGKTAAKAVDTKPDASGGDKSKPVRKGITIVSKKPSRRPKAPKPVFNPPPPSEQLLGPNSKFRKPLIQPVEPEAGAGGTKKGGRGRRSTLTKAEIDGFRERLLSKRAELIGAVSSLEEEALQSAKGDRVGGGAPPEDEEGSESFDRVLSLNLAAADRRLINEIDDALKRIKEGTYGVCEISGRAIRKARLQELPWARLSIEAARELEEAGGGAV